MKLKAIQIRAQIAMMLLVKELLGQQQDMLDRLWNINRELKWS